MSKGVVHLSTTYQVVSPSISDPVCSRYGKYERRPRSQDNGGDGSENRRA